MFDVFKAAFVMLSNITAYIVAIVPMQSHCFLTSVKSNIYQSSEALQHCMLPPYTPDQVNAFFYHSLVVQEYCCSFKFKKLTILIVLLLHIQTLPVHFLTISHNIAID